MPDAIGVMPLQARSLGREVDVWRPRSGVVHSVFERAINLLVDGELWTVMGAARADGPFGIRLPPRDARFNVGAADRVDIRAGYVGIGGLVIDCRAAPRWEPARWRRPAPGLAARLATVEHAARSRAWGESAAMASEVTDALRGSDAQLARAVRRTVGRGPGLTPAGDDVLAGMLALLASGAAGAAGTRASARLAGALAGVLHTTSDISRHLLLQAARGLPGRALHDLGLALMDDATHEALMDALDLMLEHGCTSGADACMGLSAACRFTFGNVEGLAA